MDVALVTFAQLPGLTAGDGLLRNALLARGLDARPLVWDDPDADWSAPAVSVIRSTWDYWDRREEFLAWARAAGSRTMLCNDADVLRWNTHKGYLMELEDRGAPVVPTAWLAQGDAVDLAELGRTRGWEQVVVKPAVSAGSVGTVRGPSGAEELQAHLDGLVADGDAMVQPYLSSVERHGELSLLFADHRPTHAVRKVPATGDYRIQEHLGGTYTAVEPPADAVELGRWIVEATGHRLLYARVDLLRADDGAWQLAELEATEPDLYLHVVPEAADAYAEAIAARVRGG